MSRGEQKTKAQRHAETNKNLVVVGSQILREHVLIGQKDVMMARLVGVDFVDAGGTDAVSTGLRIIALRGKRQRKSQICQIKSTRKKDNRLANLRQERRRGRFAAAAAVRVRTRSSRVRAGASRVCIVSQTHLLQDAVTHGMEAPVLNLLAHLETNRAALDFDQLGSDELGSAAQTHNMNKRLKRE